MEDLTKLVPAELLAQLGFPGRINEIQRRLEDYEALKARLAMREREMLSLIAIVDKHTEEIAKLKSRKRCLEGTVER